MSAFRCPLAPDANVQIIHGAHARDLARHLPGMVASSDWVFLYSDARHGASLKTFLARCEGWEPTLVVIEASVDSTSGDGGDGGGSISGSPAAATAAATAVAAATVEVAAATNPVSEKGSEDKKRGRVVFGGFASGAQWKKSMGRSFDGNGQSFLFSFNKGVREGRGGGGGDGGGGGGSDRSGALSVYPWAGSDRCFMTSDDAVGLGMGGGGDAGNFGFFLDPDLRKGSSGWCETFRNQPLAAAVPSVTAASLMAGATGAASGASNVGGAGVGVDGSTGRAGGVFEVVSVEVWGFRVPKTPERLSRVAL